MQSLSAYTILSATRQSRQCLRLKLGTVEVLGVLSAHRGLTRWAERIASQSEACCRLIAASSEQSDSRRQGLFFLTQSLAARSDLFGYDREKLVVLSAHCGFQ